MMNPKCPPSLTMPHVSYTSRSPHTCALQWNDTEHYWHGSVRAGQALEAGDTRRRQLLNADAAIGTALGSVNNIGYNSFALTAQFSPSSSPTLKATFVLSLSGANIGVSPDWVGG